jgi:hypothetical protein
VSHATTTPNTYRIRLWFRRIGLAGFAFFLIKGLLWLAVLAGAWHLS